MSEVKSVTVMLVEQRPEHLAVLERILQALGCKVLQAASGKDALSLILKEDVDLLLLALHLPDMPGLEVAKLLRGKVRTQPVSVMLIAGPGNEESDTLTGYGVGEIDVVTLPLEEDVVAKKIKTFLALIPQRIQLERQVLAFAYQNQRLETFHKTCFQRQQALQQRFRITLTTILGLTAALRNQPGGKLNDKQLEILGSLEQQGRDVLAEMRGDSKTAVSQPQMSEAGFLEQTLRTAPVSQETPAVRILLAEDNRENAVTLSQSLKLYGYAVTHAVNGKEALRLTFELVPDLIIMDIRMPEMDGLETTRLIRAEPTTCHIPIVMLTALSMPSDREHAEQVGANAFVNKPVTLRALLRIIQEQLPNAPAPHQ